MSSAKLKPRHECTCPCHGSNFMYLHTHPCCDGLMPGITGPTPPPVVVDLEKPTLRDQFAMHALGWMARIGGQVGAPERLAYDAYRIADAMLKARDATDAD